MRVMHWREKADVFCGLTLLSSVHSPKKYLANFLKCILTSEEFLFGTSVVDFQHFAHTTTARNPLTISWAHWSKTWRKYIKRQLYTIKIHFLLHKSCLKYSHQKLHRKYTNPAYRHYHFCKQNLTAPPSVGGGP